MTPLTYAGIGARATPTTVLRDMTVMAGWLAGRGWHLATGGAAGADSAFARGAPAGRRTLYLPWSGYNGCSGPDCRVLTPDELAACMVVAGQLHPAWERCSQAVRKLHARNVAILLGRGIDTPVHAVVAWSPRTACERLLAIHAGQTKFAPALAPSSVRRHVPQRYAKIRHQVLRQRIARRVAIQLHGRAPVHRLAAPG